MDMKARSSVMRCQDQCRALSNVVESCNGRSNSIEVVHDVVVATDRIPGRSSREESYPDPRIVVNALRCFWCLRHVANARAETTGNVAARSAQVHSGAAAAAARAETDRPKKRIGA